MCFAMIVDFLNEKLCVLPAGIVSRYLPKVCTGILLSLIGFYFHFLFRYFLLSFPLFGKAGLDTEGGAAITLGTFPVLWFSSVLPAVVLLALAD